MAGTMKSNDNGIELLVDDEPIAVSATTPRASEYAMRSLPPMPAVATGVLCGFDLQDAPLLTGLPSVPNEVVRARSATSLSQAVIGATVVVVFESGDVRQPIILGVLERQGHKEQTPTPLVSIDADQDSVVITADRQIVLRCGESSITLTRAGKVIIKGSHIVSRSSGYNRIKGAAVDIN